MYSTAVDVIRQRHGDVSIRLCKETVALHRRLGTSQRSCCYSEAYWSRERITPLIIDPKPEPVIV
jgi:hypothetical protein